MIDVLDKPMAAEAPPVAADEPSGVAKLARRLLSHLATHREDLSPMLIVTHDYPDPDALAAGFGMQYLAKEGFGIESRIVYRGEVGRMENREMVKLFRIPIQRYRPILLRRHASVVLVDTQPTFENNPFPANRRATIVIDQHAGAPPLADLALVDPDCGASCVIVGRALLDKGIDLPQRLATSIAYGILTDTFEFYRNQRSDVVRTYLDVLPHCDMRKLARVQNPVRPRQFFSTLGKGIREAMMYRKTLVTHLGGVDTPDRVAQVAEFLLVYRRVNWCLVTGRHKGRLHASLRSTRLDAKAGEVLRGAFYDPRQAGGHGPIAGGSCRVGKDASEESWTAKEKSLEQRLVRRLRIPSRLEPRKPFLR
jgi:nanoRNase/pAp phosphatase (c-di-AMP/oligoRNAs hydrolase)